MSRFIVALVAASLLVPSLAQAAAPELSTTSRLQDRREVAAGDRATRSASRTAGSTPTAGTSPARWAASGRRR